MSEIENNDRFEAVFEYNTINKRRERGGGEK